jgi:glycosyltransferase involved in cell wall biosynthesis
VYDQIWDNIEVILVNDGSTDGTRKIIAEWEPKLRARGYEVVIIDQENQGVAAAVRNGMLRMTGTYFCCPDCDDTLDKEYVSAMASCLEEYPEYEYCLCDFLITFGNGKASYVLEMQKERLDKHMLENFMFFRIDTSACKYMIRKSYVKKCKIADCFETRQRVSQEPQIVIPLILGGGRLKYIERALYLRKILSEGVSASLNTFEKCVCFWDGYYDIIIKTLEKQNVNSSNVQKFITLARIARLQQLLKQTSKYIEEHDKNKNKWAKEAEGLIRNHFKLEQDFNGEAIASECDLFFDAFVRWVLDEPRKKIDPPCDRGRVIACGVLGRQAKRLLPVLLHTELAPTELWDASAGFGTRFENRTVLKPDYEKLTERDTMLILPTDKAVAQEIRDRLARTDIGQCLCNDDITAYLSSRKFSLFAVPPDRLLET